MFCYILILFYRTLTQRGGVCLLVGLFDAARRSTPPRCVVVPLLTQRRRKEEVHTSSLCRCPFFDATTTQRGGVHLLFVSLSFFNATTTQRGGAHLLVVSLSLFRRNDDPMRRCTPPRCVVLPFSTQRRRNEEVHTSSLCCCPFFNTTTQRRPSEEVSSLCRSLVVMYLINKLFILLFYDDPWSLPLQTRTRGPRVRVWTGKGTGTAADTRGLPVSFTNRTKSWKHDQKPPTTRWNYQRP